MTTRTFWPFRLLAPSPEGAAAEAVDSAVEAAVEEAVLPPPTVHPARLRARAAATTPEISFLSLISLILCFSFFCFFFKGVQRAPSLSFSISAFEKSRY